MGGMREDSDLDGDGDDDVAPARRAACLDPPQTLFGSHSAFLACFAFYASSPAWCGKTPATTGALTRQTGRARSPSRSFLLPSPTMDDRESLSPARGGWRRSGAGRES